MGRNRDGRAGAASQQDAAKTDPEVKDLHHGYCQTQDAKSQISKGFQPPSMATGMPHAPVARYQPPQKRSTAQQDRANTSRYHPGSLAYRRGAQDERSFAAVDLSHGGVALPPSTVEAGGFPSAPSAQPQPAPDHYQPRYQQVSWNGYHAPASTPLPVWYFANTAALGNAFAQIGQQWPATYGQTPSNYSYQVPYPSFNAHAFSTCVAAHQRPTTWVAQPAPLPQGPSKAPQKQQRGYASLHSRDLGDMRWRVNKRSRQLKKQPKSPEPTKLTLPIRNNIRSPSPPPLDVPVPTAQYLAQASREPRTVDGNEHPKLLVIDLNGTLIHRPFKKQPRHYVERPFVQHFLKYLLENFYVMIWSSARLENVKAMCDTLFTSQQRRQLVAVWSRDDLGLTREQYNNKTQTYKRLSKIWNVAKRESWHPYASNGEAWDQHNTLLIDDSAIKAASEPFNLVEIPEFTGAEVHVDFLQQVVGYLNVVRDQADVSCFIKRIPFKPDGGWSHVWDVQAQQQEGSRNDGRAAAQMSYPSPESVDAPPQPKSPSRHDRPKDVAAGSAWTVVNRKRDAGVPWRNGRE